MAGSFVLFCFFLVEEASQGTQSIILLYYSPRELSFKGIMVIVDT
jgi:hypothetical protein